MERLLEEVVWVGCGQKIRGRFYTVNAYGAEYSEYARLLQLDGYIDGWIQAKNALP